MANTTEQATRNKRLHVFLGKWHTTGDIYDRDGSKTGTVDAIDTYEWLPGEYAMIHYADSTMGDIEIHGVEVIGYDTSRQAYFGPFFDDQGSAGWEEITLKDGIWTWHGQDVMGVKYHRCRATFTDKDTLTATHEFSEDDKLWHTWMKITLTRISHSSAR